MTTTSATRQYSIRDAAELTGLPASTLRYYESVGLIAPISRGESSKHRVYSEEDVDLVVWIACLSATGMSISDMRRYLENRTLGADGAGEQIELLTAQRRHLAQEAKRLRLRQQYVDLKIAYWQAVAAGDDAKAASISDEARVLASELKTQRA